MVLVADAGGGGGGSPYPQFDEHSPDGSAIVSDGEAVSQTGTGFYSVRDTVVGQHTRAQSGVEGEPAAAMPAAPRRVKSSAGTMYRRAVVAGGAVSEFGQAVSTFNSKVRGWNGQINAAADREEAQEVYEDRRSAFTTAESTLSDAAGDARYRIDNWDTDSVVRSLWAGGALPMSAMTMFSQLGLQPSELTDLPPDLAGLSDGELARELQTNPELVENPEVMEAVRERIGDYDPDQAGRDAEAIQDGDADAAGKAALVNVYGAYAQENGKTLPANAATYLRDFVAAAFPGDDKSYTGALPVATAMQETLDESGAGWTEGLLGTSLLLASNAKLDPAYHRGPTNPAPLTLGRGAVPQAVWDALEDTPRPTFGRAPTGYVSGGEGYADLAGLLGDADSDIEAGHVFSREMTDTTADLIGDLRTWREEGADTGSYGRSRVDDDSIDRYLESHTPHMQQMIQVATRNEGANAGFLDAAAKDAGQAPERLANLYTFDWNDDGQAVAGYTDWISGYKGSDDPEQQSLANEAMADLVDVTSSRDIELDGVHYETESGGQATFVEALMQHAHPETGQQLSVGEQNPGIIRSLSEASGSYLHDFAQGGPRSGETSVVQTSDGEWVATTMDDRSRFFTLLGTDQVAADNLARTAGVYQQGNMDQAVRDGSVEEIGVATKSNTRLDALIAAGRYNAGMVTDSNTYQNQDAAFEEQLENAAIGRKIISGAGAPIPYAGGFASGAGTIYEEIATRYADPPTAEFNEVAAEKFETTDAQNMHAADELYEALSRNEDELPPQAQTLLEQMHNDDGTGWDDLDRFDRDEVQQELLGNPLYDRYRETNQTTDVFGYTARNWQQGDGEDVASHNNGETQTLLRGDREEDQD